MYNLEDNSLVITNNVYKKQILKYFSNNKKLLNIKIMSMNELINKYYFTYDNEAIYYLIKKYNLKYDVAVSYLNNLVYVAGPSSVFKLKKLYDLKQELLANDLLIFDDMFKSYLKQKKVVFIGFDDFNKLEEETIKQIRKITDVRIVNKEYNNWNHDVYEFDTIEDEVTFVADSISSLLVKNVPISNIKLTNIDDDYIDVIHRIFGLYNLKIKEDKMLYATDIAQTFLNNFKVPFDIDFLKDKYSSTEINALVAVLNKFVSKTDAFALKELIISELKKTKVVSVDTNNTVEVVDYKNLFDDNDYLFMLNFNLNSIPNMYKDEEYITDNLKSGLFLDTTLEKNIKEKNRVVKAIKSIKNLVITYKKRSPYQVFYPSNLIEDMHLMVITKEKDLLTSYSKKNDLVSLTKKLDNLIKYGSKDKSLDVLYSNYRNIAYLVYDNKYTNLIGNEVRAYVNNKISLSYSSMTNYYKCAFRYYLANILKLDIYEDNFNTYIGSLFHYVLQMGLKNDIDVCESIDTYVSNSDRRFTNKELFFINSLKDDLVFILDTIKRQLKFSKLRNALFEEEVVVEKSSKLKVTFKGFIDKLMYSKEDDRTIVAIIDYKTGQTPYDLSLVKYGLNMQLPIYLYLAKHSEKLLNVTFAGFYIQEILNKDVLIDKKKDYQDAKRELLKLHGYSNINEAILEKFDSSYKDSEVIKSLKMTNAGSFYSYSKVISDEQINNLICLVDNKIHDAVLNIEEANFSINPKRTKAENISCKFCKFKDICFKKPSDEVEIVEEKDLSFLGGDINA